MTTLWEIVDSHFGFEDRILVLVVPVPDVHTTDSCRSHPYCCHILLIWLANVLISLTLIVFRTKLVLHKSETSCDSFHNG